MNHGKNGLTTPNPSDLFEFAFCGDRLTFFVPVFLKSLSELAEAENWTSPSAKHEFDWLFYYVIKTFERCFSQNKISYSSDKLFCVFNTGLITENGEDIYGYFIPNKKTNAQKWFFKGFAESSSRVFATFVFEKPLLATYWDESNVGFAFDCDAPLEFSSEHIFDDHWEDGERFPEDLVKLGKSLAISSIRSAFEISKIRVKRNHRLVVPQFYNGKIMFLMPIKIAVSGDKKITMALAIEKLPNGTYRANTIFCLSDAYKKARLITKPEANWLIEE